MVVMVLQKTHDTQTPIGYKIIKYVLDVQSEHNYISNKRYIVNYMFRPLYWPSSGCTQRINWLYSICGIFWGDEISFTIVSGMNTIDRYTNRYHCTVLSMNE